MVNAQGEARQRDQSKKVGTTTRFKINILVFNNTLTHLFFYLMRLMILNMSHKVGLIFGEFHSVWFGPTKLFRFGEPKSFEPLINFNKDYG